MNYEVIGIEEVNYTSKKTGLLVIGRRLHLTYDFDSKANAEGIGVESIFSTSENAKSAKIGDRIEVYYNKYGNVQDIRILDK
jgi:hypothetical protein